MKGKMRLRNKIRGRKELVISLYTPPPSRNGNGMKRMTGISKKGRNLLYIDLLIIMYVPVPGCE